MDEMTKTLMKLVEENAKYKVALEFLKQEYAHDKEKGYANKEVGMALGFVGMLPKEVKVIEFDNCKDTAMEVE